LANCLLAKLLLYHSFDHKQVEELSLLVAKLVAEASSQLKPLPIETVLGLGIGKTI